MIDLSGWELKFLGDRQTAVKLLCGALAVFVFCGACSVRSESKTDKNENAEEKGRSEQPVAVSRGVAVSREVPSFIQATGSLTAQETSDVAPKVAGQIVSTPVSVGAFVRQGDVIARLDEKDARLRLQEAQAGVRQAEAGVRQAEARLGLTANGTFNASTIPEVQSASANYEQVQAELRQAEANEKRYRELVETGDVSLQNYEGYRTLRDTARARLNSARQQLEAARNAARQSNQAIKSAEAAVESARSQVAIAQQALTNTTVRAPYGGFVSSRPVAVGEYVSTSSIIATILRTNPLKLQLQVPEANVPFITQGMGVSLEVDAFRDRKFAGTVTAVNPAVDPASRAATIEASVENNNNQLRSGMFATARIVRQGGNTGVFVPRTAVFSDQTTQSYRVFVIQGDIAKLRVVQLGTEEGDSIQILNGVNADEVVATSNLAELYEGAKVRVQ